jgi:hypothetical protein
MHLFKGLIITRKKKKPNIENIIKAEKMGKDKNPYLPKTHKTYKAIKAGCPLS